jgi:hypothetical protein
MSCYPPLHDGVGFPAMDKTDARASPRTSFTSRSASGRSFGNAAEPKDGHGIILLILLYIFVDSRNLPATFNLSGPTAEEHIGRHRSLPDHTNRQPRAKDEIMAKE